MNKRINAIRKWGLRIMANIKASYLKKTGPEAVFVRPELDLDFLKSYTSTLPPRIKRMVENWLIGIEIEVEHAYPGMVTSLWIIERDGSLRNEGLEYKTVYPTKVGDLWKSLTEYSDWMKYVRKDIPEAYQSSERTSVHVHVDVRMMTEKDIQKLLAIYVFLEDALFNYCGPNRKHNVFCAPINSTGLYEAGIKGLIHAWHKYSAVNLKTIQQFGTVEFRGMAGTDNIRHIMTWTVMCVLLVAAAELTTREELLALFKDLKTASDYKRAISSFLYGFTELLHWDDAILDNSVTNARMILAKE